MSRSGTSPRCRTRTASTTSKRSSATRDKRRSGLSDTNTPQLANVGALGLGGFALSTFILNIVNAGWVDAKT
ncbi:hypothetical protein DRJ23_04205, partial [Candidatus Acetothermia bacterium]